MSDLVVMKFGGTSVGDATAIRRVTDILAKAHAGGDRVLAVCSAMHGVTDLLLRGAREAAAGNGEPAGSIAAELRRRNAEVIAALVTDPASARALEGRIEPLVAEFELLCHAVRVLEEASPRAR